MEHNSINDKVYSINLGQEEIKVKEKMTSFTTIEINKIKIVVKGKFIKIAEVREDWDEDIVNPQLTIEALKKSGVRIDLFTFIQRLPESRPKYDYHMEWDSVAAIPITNYEQWIKNQIPKQTRNRIKKAAKMGVVIKNIDYGDELIRGISDIYNASPIRQGKKNYKYNMEFEMVKKLNSTFLERCDFIGAYYENELIGYIKIVYSDKYARTMGIMGKAMHRDKYPMNLLVAKAVEMCAEKKVPYLTYAKYDYGNVGSDSLKEFKKNNGFENIIIPRYYAAFNYYGDLCIKLRLYRGIKNLLPKWMVRKIRKAFIALSYIRNYKRGMYQKQQVAK